ncbi:MAG: endonuclease V [Rhodobacteraceae bacterium]|nr:endonuclease V [Paracoccaceae bacterium]
MIAALDAHYRGDTATVGCVLFRNWTDPAPTAEHSLSAPAASDYTPGQFYLRELPPLLAMLSSLEARPNLLLIDGYVWLGPERPGLGKRLSDALEGATPVVGVAKTPFKDAAPLREVLRGKSIKPLFVTAQGIPLDAAAKAIAAMHGPWRLPTLLKRADQLSRKLLN